MGSPIWFRGETLMRQFCEPQFDVLRRRIHAQSTQWPTHHVGDDAVMRALPFTLRKPAAGEAQLRALAGLAHLGRLSAAQYQAKRGVIGGRASRASVPVQLAGFFAHASKSPSVVSHYVRRRRVVG